MSTYYLEGLRIKGLKRLYRRILKQHAKVVKVKEVNNVFEIHISSGEKGMYIEEIILLEPSWIIKRGI